MILEMANKYNLKFLDVQEVLKDETGYGNPAYITEDGFHLTYLGHSVVKEYIKTHALDQEVIYEKDFSNAYDVNYDDWLW